MEASTPSEIDIETNRANIAYARSTKLITSWLPPPKTAEESYSSTHPHVHDDDDSDFKSMPEKSGLGSKVESDSDVSGIRRSGASRDKLLEQLLGKGAAGARKKALDAAASRDSPVKKPVDAKGLAGRPKLKRGAESSDDEEGGRSSAFKSRKAKAEVRNTSEQERAADQDEDDNNAARSSQKQHENQPVARTTASDDDEKPAKRGKNSYLDELLSSRGKKSKKKKNK